MEKELEKVKSNAMQQETQEVEELKSKVKLLEEAERDAIEKVQIERENMATEVSKLKQELVDRQTAYQENIDVLDSRLKEVISLNPI